jgi:putative phosphoesterase
MKRIGLLSDTHNFLDPAILRHFETCDEIWHAGDFGSVGIADQIRAHKPLRGVYGNVDGLDIRTQYPERLSWTCEEVKVLMTHIGGSPPKYSPGIRKELTLQSPQLFICGHSHILKIVYDQSLKCLYMNPGAAGNQGWHKIKTLVRFTVDGKELKDCQVIELGEKG